MPLTAPSCPLVKQASLRARVFVSCGTLSHFSRARTCPLRHPAAPMLFLTNASTRWNLTAYSCHGLAMAKMEFPTQLLCRPGRALPPGCLEGFSLVQRRPPSQMHCTCSLALNAHGPCRELSCGQAHTRSTPACKNVQSRQNACAHQLPTSVSSCAHVPASSDWLCDPTVGAGASRTQ